MAVAGVAAGHAATTKAGIDVLRAGGNAADAAVAAMFAAGVAETVMTGLGGGGFAIYYEAARRRAVCFDFFVAVPGIGARGPALPPTPVELRFGAVPLEFAVGPGSVAVPGVPAGCAALHRRFGRLPWARLLEPALALARSGAALPPSHALALAALAPALTAGEGRSVYAPGGRLLRAGERVRPSGLERTLTLLAEQGAEPFYRGEPAADFAAEVQSAGGRLTEADMRAYRVRRAPLDTARLAGWDLSGRRDLAGVVEAAADLDAVLDADLDKRVAVTARALNSLPDRAPGDTTNVSAMDGEGNACVATTTLGVGSGLWPGGWGVHLNSMLGEGELRRGRLRPGARMGSMMCPVVVLDPRTGELRLAAGAAGASRIRSALLQFALGTLADGLSLEEAVTRPRFHPVGEVAHVEGALDPAVCRALRRAGYQLEEWSRDLHYFGGVSAVGAGAAAGDPRRDGSGAVLRGDVTALWM